VGKYQYVDQTNIPASIILQLTQTSEIAIPKAQQQRYLTRPKTQQVFNYPTKPWIRCNAKILFIKLAVQRNIFHYLDITFIIDPTNSTATDFHHLLPNHLFAVMPRYLTKSKSQHNISSYPTKP